MLARRNLGEGGPIARRPSPARNRRCACRAATACLVVAPPPQELAAAFNAKRQRPKDARTITNDNSSMTNSQCPLCHPRNLRLFAKVCRSPCSQFAPFQIPRLVALRLCFLAPWHFHPRLKLSGPKCLFRLPLQPLHERHVDPLQISKILKNTNNCCYLRPLAAHSRKNPCPAKSHGDGASLQVVLPSKLNHPAFFSVPSVPSRPFHKSTAITMSATFQRFALFSSFSTLFPRDCQRARKTQPIAPAPVATKSDAAAISKTFQLLTLF
jgi:hypothetical protein